MKRNFIIGAIALIMVVAVISVRLTRDGWKTSTTEISDSGSVQSINSSPQNSASVQDILRQNVTGLSDLTARIEALPSMTAAEAEVFYSALANSDQAGWIRSFGYAMSSKDSVETRKHISEIKKFQKEGVIDLADANTLLKSVYLRIVEQDDNNIPSRMALADIYLSEGGAPMQGIQQYLKVVEIDPDNEEAIYRLGLLSIQSNQLKKAKERFEKLISLQPENETYRNLLLQICRELGDSDCIETAEPQDSKNTSINGD